MHRPSTNNKTIVDRGVFSRCGNTLLLAVTLSHAVTVCQSPHASCKPPLTVSESLKTWPLRWSALEVKANLQKESFCAEIITLPAREGYQTNTSEDTLVRGERRAILSHIWHPVLREGADEIASPQTGVSNMGFLQGHQLATVPCRSWGCLIIVTATPLGTDQWSSHTDKCVLPQEGLCPGEALIACP